MKKPVSDFVLDGNKAPEEIVNEIIAASNFMATDTTSRLNINGVRPALWLREE